MDLILLRS